MMQLKILETKLLSLNKRIFAVLVLVFNINTVFSQINLVQNPGFENITSCPDWGGQIDSAIGWSTFKNGGGSTPDLLSVCCTYPQLCGVPSHSSGFQYPKTGNNYTGIIVDCNFLTDICREYIQSKLYQRLKAGKSYCVKFYCNLSDFSTAYIKPLGAYLDSGNISTTSPYGLPTVTPQIYSQQSLNDTINWMKIEESFVAIGNEEYISIGNFFTDSSSGIEFFGAPTSWMSYYYIDDVSVIDVSLPAYAGIDTLIQPGDSVFIGRQPEVGLNEDCIWFVNGLPIDTIAGMWVKPDSTTTYILEQTICGNVSWDTVTVSVYGTGVVRYSIETTFKIYPNPVTHLLHIESPITKAMISITNLLGQEVLHQEVQEKQFIMDVSKLGKGVYFLQMKSEKGVFVKKFVKE